MSVRAFGLLMVVFVFLNTTNSQVLINEIQSSNVVTAKDEFNEYPDWIELINNSGNTVNLGGWYLSDEKDSLDKWSFPAIQLLPSQHLLVFASGKDLKQLPAYWHTIIDAGSEWKYVVPTDTVSANWKSVNYSDAYWPSGTSGFGYADDDDSTPVSYGTISIYTRKKFSLSSLGNITSIFLHVDYDDGFVAYLNGAEVARVNLGTAGTAVTYNQLASPDHEALMYQGQQPSVFDISAFIGQLVVGENTLAIEVHNNSASSSDLSLITFLTLGKTSLDSASEQPSQFLVLGNKLPHTNFKLKSDGEVLVLSNASKQIIDSLSIPAIQPDASYGRLTGNITQFKYFVAPTPGILNGSEGYNLLVNDKVDYSIPGGYHPAGFNIQLSAAGNMPVYYTTDGSEPTAASGLYTSAIYISSNAIIRSRIIVDGYLPGKIYASTYVTDRPHDLPIVGLSTAPANLWDYNTGMYVMGPNAQASNPYFGANFWMEWEKPFGLEIYNTNGNCLINQGAGASIFGAWSRAREQKSFALFSRKNYGISEFNASLFSKCDLDEYKSIVIRNAGNDWDFAFMRDGLITDITSHLGLEHQAFQPAVTYLNGEYWGIYNMREKVNEDFLASHWYVDPDDITILTNNSEVVEGDNADYLALVDYLNSNPSLASSDKYNYISDRIDVDNYIKYQLVQIYIHNTDWPGNNIKYWKTSNPAGKWRWILYDTDFGIGLYDNESYSSNTLAFALEPNGPSWPNPDWSTLLFRRMVTNIGFRNNFINQIADNINTTFTPSNVNYYVDSISDLYINEMPYHKARWGQSYDSWLNEVERIKSWASNRPDYMRDYVQSTFNLTSQKNITLNVSNKQHGEVRLNTITPKSYPFTGVYFQGVSVEMEAIPAPGYKFVNWEGDNVSYERTITYNPAKNATFKAVFEPAASDEISLIINEINYNSSTERPSGDWIEIYNNGVISVDMSGFLLRDSYPDSGYVFPAGIILNPDKYLVITKNHENFIEYNPSILNNIGDFDFGLSSDGDELRLFDAQSKLLDAVDYYSFLPWPTEANGTGITLELKSPDLDNGQPENWVAVKQGGTPGAINSVLSAITQPEFADNAGLFTAFPNNFKDFTTITYNLNSASSVRIEVVDLQGRLIETLTEGYFPQGDNYIDWIPKPTISGGLYLIRLISESNSKNISVIYLKP